MTDAATRALGAEQYLRLTTFRKDGTPVGTAVWVVPDSRGTLLVVTSTQTGKVKRLRHTARVLLAPCDRRGTVADGAREYEGTARLVDDPAQVERLHRMLVVKYGLFARAIQLVGRLRRRTDSIAIEITVTSPLAEG